MRKGRILSFFRGVDGVPGIARTSQKSSARRPDLYPCRVIDADSVLGVVSFSFPLSVAWASVLGFCLHTKVCGVPGW